MVRAVGIEPTWSCSRNRWPAIGPCPNLARPGHARRGSTTPWPRVAVHTGCRAYFKMPACRDGGQPREPARQGTQGRSCHLHKGPNNAGRAAGPVPSGRGRRLSPYVVTLGSGGMATLTSPSSSGSAGAPCAARAHFEIGSQTRGLRTDNPARTPTPPMHLSTGRPGRAFPDQDDR